MKIGSRYLHCQLSQRSRSDNGLRAVRRVERFARFHIHLTAVAHRQIEREGGTLPLARTVKPNLALKQTRQLARNREAEAGTTILAAGGAVCLLEGLENQPLLVFGDTDARIG